MAKRKGASTSGPRTRSRAAKERQVEDTRRLDKLPQEVWDKILDHLEENDLFPLALSCRYFRQKQKELVERTRQNGSGSGKPRRALKTTFHRMPVAGQPASADYLRFCSKEEVRDAELKVVYLVLMAAFHGHLPLLQELLKALNTLEEAVISYIAICAGEFHFRGLFFFVSASDFFSLHSEGRPSGDLAVARNPGAVQAE